jgi:hypothetical protein
MQFFHVTMMPLSTPRQHYGMLQDAGVFTALHLAHATSPQQHLSRVG